MIRSLLAAAALTTLLLPTAARADEVMAHLASFKSRAAAEKSWHWLADQYSSVLYTKATVRVVELGGKGTWYRVYADGDQTIVRMLCDSMNKRKKYCRLHDRATLEPVR